MVGPVLITETHHGFVCANSGIDQSSSGAHGRVVLLPEDSDASARRIRAGFAELGVDVAVIVSDTFGRPWREGQTDVAIGIAGIAPMHSYIGEVDPHGHEFRVQELCVVDELAGAAELVKGNTSRVPVAGHPRLRLAARRRRRRWRPSSATPSATCSADAAASDRPTGPAPADRTGLRPGGRRTRGAGRGTPRRTSTSATTLWPPARTSSRAWPTSSAA